MRHNKLFKHSVVVGLLMAMVFAPVSGYAQGSIVAALPEPGEMVGLSGAFEPLQVKGLVVYPDKPFNFDFIVDSGNDARDPAYIRAQSQRIAKYFLAAVTVPEQELWVNLSPFEKDRIIEGGLGETALGRDMLAQDYILKQLSASLVYPEQGLGKQFWAGVYKEAEELFGTTDVPVDTFNKVWIVPQQAEVYEQGNSVFVTGARLKVMLDSDHNAMMHNTSGEALSGKALIAQKFLRQIVIPALEKEVNEGRNFAPIRQMFNAVILAKWYREMVQDTLLSDRYAGKNLVAGVTSGEKMVKEKVYERYVAAYRKGVFNYIKEDSVTAGGDAVPRKYFSGGENLYIPVLSRKGTFDKAQSFTGDSFRVAVVIQDAAQSLGDGFRSLPLWGKIVAPLAVAGVITGGIFYFQYQQHLGEQWVSSKSAANMTQVAALAEQKDEGHLFQLMKVVGERQERMEKRIIKALRDGNNRVDDDTKDPVSDAKRYAGYDALVVSYAALSENDVSATEERRIGGMRLSYWKDLVHQEEEKAKEAQNEGRLFRVLKMLAREKALQQGSIGTIAGSLERFNHAIPSLPGEKKDIMEGHYARVLAFLERFKRDEHAPEEVLYTRADHEMRGRTDVRLYTEAGEYKVRRDHRDLLQPFFDKIIKPSADLARGAEKDTRQMISDEHNEQLQLGLAAMHTHDPVPRSETTYDSKGRSSTRYWTDYEDNSGIYRAVAASFASSARSHARQANKELKELKQMSSQMLASPVFNSENLQSSLNVNKIDVSANGFGVLGDVFLHPVFNLVVSVFDGKGDEALDKIVGVREQIEVLEGTVNGRLQREVNWVEDVITRRITEQASVVDGSLEKTPV